MTQKINARHDAKRGLDLKDPLVSGLIISVVRILGLLPYRWRVPVGGWFVAHVVAPIIGYRKRIRENLDLIFPDMPEAEKSSLVRRVPEQMGRTMTEMFSPEEFRRVAGRARITGPGLDALNAAHASGRPIIMVSGHIGNYDAGRSALIQRGMRVGALYRRMNYRHFNDFYVSKISAIGEPLFLRGRRGMSQMLRFLKEGNSVALLIDQHMREGERLSFFGHPAYTALSAADMALKYDALLVPCYALRLPDGMNFEVIIEAPIPHTDAVDMTQKLNDSLEAQIRAHMEQWLWIHRRWKQKKLRRQEQVSENGGPEIPPG